MRGQIEPIETKCKPLKNSGRKVFWTVQLPFWPSGKLIYPAHANGKMESAFGLKLSNEVSAFHQFCCVTTEQSEGVTVFFGDEITGKDQ